MEPATLSTREYAEIAAALVALAALIKGVFEYSSQGAQRRAEHFLAMRKRLKDDALFKRLCGLLETDDPALVDVAFEDKRDFLGLFEEVALLLNSRLIRRPVAHYMFGYYAIRCWDSKFFWIDVQRESIYWALFRDFVAQMKVEEDGFAFRRRRYRF